MQPISWAGNALFYLFFVALLALSGCRDVLDAETFDVSKDSSCGPLQIRGKLGCLAVGVERCGAGFESDKAGGCRAIVSTTRCGEGLFARLGDDSCVPIGFAECAASRFPPVSEDDLGARGVLRISSDAAPGGDGSEERPFSSLGAALAAAPGPLTLLLAAGEYEAGLELDRRVHIIGPCAAKAKLIGPVSGPVLKLTSGAEGAFVQGVALVGGTTGVEISGARDVRMKGLWIHDVAGHGVTVTDIQGPTTATVESSLVELTRDAGLSSYGAVLTLKDSVVRDVVPRTELGRAVGLEVGASPLVRDGFRDSRIPGSLCVERSIVEDCAGAGIAAKDSWLEVNDSVVRDVAPDAYHAGRGIWVHGEDASQFWNPATDAFGTGCWSDGIKQAEPVAVRRSLIENISDVGVSAWNLEVTVEDSVVRAIGSTSSGRCAGNGIHVRADLIDGDSLLTSSTVSHSVIESTTGTGVLVEGAGLSLEDSVIRDVATEPCDANRGSAVELSHSVGQISKGSVRRSWLARSPRAASAFGESVLDVYWTVLECNREGLTGDWIVTGDVSCECEGRQVACGEVEPDYPAQLATGCNAKGATPCFRTSLGSLGAVESGLSRAALWRFDRDYPAPVRADKRGLAELAGLPFEGPSLVAASSLGHSAGLVLVAPHVPDSKSEPARVLLPRWDDASFSRFAGASQFDMRDAPLVMLRVCSSPWSPVCVALPGVTAELMSSELVSARYSDALRDLPNEALSATEGATVFFFGVEPGEHVVRLKAADGRLLHCEIAPTGVGWVGEEPNTLRVFVEASYSVFAAEVVCKMGG